MDYTKRIFTFFSEDDSRRKLTIAPQAPPIEYTHDGLKVALETVFDDVDISDTLLGMLNHGVDGSLSGRALRRPKDISETFCLSISGVGRFRVTYLTQRSSKVLIVDRIPFKIPTCAELNLAIPLAERLLETLRSPAGNITAVFGPSAEANSTFVYAFLQHMNNTDRGVIFTQERELSYLMRHSNCIVVQRELNTDCQTVNESINDGLGLHPTIMYIGDLVVSDQLPSLARIVEAGTHVVISVVAQDHESFAEQFKMILGPSHTLLEQRVVNTVKVTPEPHGDLSASL